MLLIPLFPAGEAQAVIAKAEAKAKAIRMLSEALTEQVIVRLKVPATFYRYKSYLSQCLIEQNPTRAAELYFT